MADGGGRDAEARGGAGHAAFGHHRVEHAQQIEVKQSKRQVAFQHHTISSCASRMLNASRSTRECRSSFELSRYSDLEDTESRKTNTATAPQDGSHFRCVSEPSGKGERCARSLAQPRGASCNSTA